MANDTKTSTPASPMLEITRPGYWYTIVGNTFTKKTQVYSLGGAEQEIESKEFQLSDSQVAQLSGLIRMSGFLLLQAAAGGEGEQVYDMKVDIGQLGIFQGKNHVVFRTEVNGYQSLPKSMKAIAEVVEKLGSNEKYDMSQWISDMFSIGGFGVIAHC